MNQRTRVLCAILSLFLLLPCLLIPTSAEPSPMPDISNATAVYFAHPESGHVVCAKNESGTVAAGSMPKLMAGLLFCETFIGRMGETVTVTPEMIETPAGYRQYGLKGETVSVEELLYLALCGSYSDAYDVLAYLASGGNAKNFVSGMNERAKALGAADTLYTDVTGVADSSLTTAYDQYLIARAAAENTFYMTVSSTERCDLIDPPIYNYNALLSNSASTGYYNSKCHGMSAGATKQGNYSLATQVRIDADIYLCIVLGGIEQNDVIYSYTVANRLVNWVAKNYTYMNVITPDIDVCRIPVTVSDMTTEVAVRTDRTLSCLLPTGLTVGKEITYSIRLSCDSLEAPVEEGIFVGYVAVMYQGKNLGTLPLYTAGTAERSGLISRLMSIRGLTKSRAARAGLVCFIVCIAAWITVESLRLRHKRHKWDKYFSRKLEAPEELARRDRTQQRRR